MQASLRLAHYQFGRKDRLERLAKGVKMTF